MNFYNAYLQGVNQTIGEHARFARQFQSNQKTASENGEVASSPLPASPLTQDPAQILNLLIMLFQMMSALQNTTETSQPSNAPVPYVPGLTASSPLTQNPAIGSLEGKFAQKSLTINPEHENIVFSPADIESVLADLQAGQYTSADLGEALMYELDQAPDKNLGAVAQLIQHFTGSGDINIASLLQNDYLLKLKPQRQEALMSIIEESGLLLNDNKPNRRLIGFIMDHLDKPGDSQSKTFIHQLLQNLHNQHVGDPESPKGKVLYQLITLAGISLGEKSLLIF